jgi:hypothetical protein
MGNGGLISKRSFYSRSQQLYEPYTPQACVGRFKLGRGTQIADLTVVLFDYKFFFLP